MFATTLTLPLSAAVILSSSSAANLSNNWKLHFYEVIRDDEIELKRLYSEYTKSPDVDIIITTGGTGLSERDITVRVTRSIITKELTGIIHLLLSRGLKATPFAALSNPFAGVKDKTLIINLPGSVKAVKESMGALKPVFAHAVEIIKNGSFKH